MRLPVETFLPLAALTLLGACGGTAAARPETAAQAAPSGPAADYPMVLGPAYVIDGVTYTPADRMNYDVVGRAGLAGEGGAAVSAAHRTLPLPSYVEVTALDSGRTALVRVERRGPMAGTNLLELSPGAAAQLGLSGTSGAAVRVRRVNPVEADRAMLRSGQAAAMRMDTPRSLLAVLMRKLDQQEGVQSTPAEAPPPVQAVAAQAEAAPEKSAKPASGKFFVQVGAFASKANADAAARKSGGALDQSGKFWRVRTGPFANEAAARAALANARRAGYSDARIQRAD